MGQGRNGRTRARGSGTRWTMSEPYGHNAGDTPGGHAATGLSRSGRLDRVLAELVGQVPEVEAAAVVSFDGLAMARTGSPR
jgi:hypothetical protein